MKILRMLQGVCILLLCAQLRAEDVLIKDRPTAKKLLAKANEASRALGWSPVSEAKLVERRYSPGNEVYGVEYSAGTFTFSKAFRLVKSVRHVAHTPTSFSQLPKLQRLGSTEIVKSKALARQVLQTLGLGVVQDFKAVEMRRTWMGMDRPVIYVECQMLVKSPLPVYKLSIPTTKMELQPKGRIVEFLNVALPTVVDPLTKPKDLEKARDTISRLLENGGEPAVVKEGDIRLMAVVWPEGERGSPEAVRNSRLRKRLLPAYLWSGLDREIWLNANTMQILGSWKLDKAMQAARKRSGG